jgi:hypothetical protein
MPNSAPRACEESMCPFMAEPGGWKCARHKAEAQQRNDQFSAVRRKRLPSTYETKFRPTLVSSGNVLCQRVIEQNGQRIRCPEMAEICHHLLDTSEYPQFVTNWLNAVMVCRPHNPPSGGDPGALEYIPTQWPTSLGGTPVPSVGPGERIPTGTELWTLATQRKRLRG